MDVSDQLLVDGDKEEIEYLSNHYSEKKNISCVNYCIVSPEELAQSTSVVLNKYQHPGGHSFCYQTITTLLEELKTGTAKSTQHR